MLEVHCIPLYAAASGAVETVLAVARPPLATLDAMTAGVESATGGAQRLGAELIASYLQLESVPYAFAVCGHGNIGLLDAFHDGASGVRVVSMHREDAAGFAADAFFRVAGRPVATITSCGPGSANLTVALGCAFLDSSAVLAITGNVPTTQFNRGPFQELGRHYQADFPSSIRPYVKRSFQATRAEMLPLVLRRAFALMLHGRPGPVNIDVPLDVFRERTSEPLLLPEDWRAGVRDVGAGDPVAVDTAAALLASAERPLIVAGQGVLLAGASERLIALVDATGIPVVTSPNGKGAIDERARHALGAVGRNGTFPANQAARVADVILALGTGFDDRATSAWEPGSTYSIPPTRLIQVDVDPSELGANYPVEVGIAGDAGLVLDQLAEAIAERRRLWADDLAPWHEAVASWQEIWSAETSRPYADGPGIDPRALVHVLREELPVDATVLADVGVHHNWLVQHWQTTGPRTLLQSWGYAAMGFGVAGAIGAKLAAPDRPAVAVCGDGGFLMTAHAVATAVEYELPIVWVVWNNGGYISIRDQQRAYFDGREIATSFRRESTGELHSADFAMLGKSMGARGTRVEARAELAQALRDALAHDGPTVIEAAVPSDIYPAATGGWTLPPLPPSRPTFEPETG